MWYRVGAFVKGEEAYGFDLTVCGNLLQEFNEMVRETFRDISFRD